ncbi:MAG TPA: alpha/beta hydrolase [Caulobacteraceae bacterium]
MEHLEDLPFRQFNLALPSRGPGEVAVLDFGRLDAPVAGVFLHANGFNARTYRRLLGPVSRFNRILAFDQRGHGATTLETRPEGRRDWLDLRDDLLAFIAVLDLKEVALCGHSMGGTVSLLAAREAPDRIHRLLLLDPVMPPSVLANGGDASPMVAAAIRRRATFASRADARAAYLGRGAFATWPEAMLEDYVEGGFRDAPDGAVELACAPSWEASNYYAAQGHDSWGALEAYPGPVRILAAETGSTCRESPGFDLGELAPRVSLTRAPGTTHFLPMERPDLVMNNLAETLLADL